MTHRPARVMSEVQTVIETLTTTEMSDARMTTLLRTVTMFPKTLDADMRSGMSDEQMASAVRASLISGRE
jgi:hypothetical protein